MSGLSESFVTVKVKSVHFDIEGAKDVIEIFAIGKKSIRKDKLYIYYNEPVETGMENTHTLLKIHDRKVTLTRMGEVKQKMEFIKGSCTHFEYQMPFGGISMAVDTKELEICEEGNHIDIKIEYILIINDHMHNMTKMHIKIEEDTKVGH